MPDFSTRYGYTGFINLEVNEETNVHCLKRGKKTILEVPNSFFNLHERVLYMKENNIDIHVLSPPSELFSYWAKADDTADLCRIYNNSVLKEVELYEKLFIPLFIIPMQAPELAIEEIKRCILLGFKGCVIGTSVNELNLYENEFVPLWEILEEHEITVFIHSNNVKVTRKDRKFKVEENLLPANEITRSVNTLILSRHLEKFNNVKILFFDGAGNYPWLSSKIHETCVTSQNSKNNLNEISKNVLNNFEIKPSVKLLKKVVCDSLVGDYRSINFLVDTISEENICFGSNYPFNSTSEIKRNIKESKLNEEAKKKVFSSNAINLLNLKKEDFKLLN